MGKSRRICEAAWDIIEPMRLIALTLATAAACGSGNGHPGDGKGSGSGSGSDAGPTIDGPPLLACSPQTGTTMTARMIGRVSGVAIVAASPPNDGRLFVIEQDGRIRIFENEQLRATEFIDISNKVVAGGEQGLLGLAFHPNYWQNNYFYVWYTATNPNINDTANPWVDVLERYTASTTDLNKADPNSGQILLSIPDFATNHNGGMLEFGSDGFLYVGTGDGGGGGDPSRNGQNPHALLGKVLRIDVDHPANSKNYGIPATNPYANTTNGAQEVFMIGVRNPWRWTFDRANGDMWIGDVGQNLWEEVDVLSPAEQVGANLGWSMYEATHCYGNYTCDPTGMFMPQWEHDHNGWAAVIGGQVYRGPCYPDLTGYYFFSDNSAHALMRTKRNGTGIDTPVDVSPSGGFPASPASIHADARGELYSTHTDGYVYHLEAGP
jgi:glucose/arabinose dehydrogenase